VIRRLAIGLVTVCLLAVAALGLGALGGRAASSLLVGSSYTQPSSDTNSAGSAQAYGYTATGSGTVSSISLDVAYGSSGTAQVGLYTDAGGRPGSLLTSGKFTNPPSGWNTTGVGPATVTAGNAYWLAVLDLSGTVNYYDHNGSGTPAPLESSSNLTTLPSSWSSGPTWSAGPASVYASGGGSPPTPTPNQTPTPPPTPTPTPSATPTPPPTFSFDDEFAGSSLGNAWTVLNRTGDASNSEQQCYQTGNTMVGGGALDLVTAADTSCSGYSYTSGAAIWSSANFTYGTVTVRAKLAGGQGTWPAIWLLGANCQAAFPTTADNVGTCNWPQPGSDEIDMAEILGSNHGSVNEQVHTGGSNPGCSAPVADTTAWHVYSLTWKAGSVVWKIDGNTTCTVYSNVPTTPMFLILNTAVGGAGGGSVNPSTLQQDSLFDYARVTQP
jgi:Glycosyl hydrolases family 16